LLSVTNSTSTVFTINARGDIQTQGVIIVKDNSFAGSIATNQEGTAEINFTYHLGTGKPVVQLTPEGEVPVFAQVLSWKKDSQQNYIGFTMKTFSLSGVPVSAVVHYSVIGKQEDYQTLGEALQVQSQPSSGGGSSDQGQVAGQQEQGEEGSSLEEDPLLNEENVVEGQEPPVVENPVPVTEPENTPVTPSGVDETGGSENLSPSPQSGGDEGGI
jgi:hypothetical protein